MTTIRKTDQPEQPDNSTGLPDALTWPAKVWKQFGATGLSLCFVVPLYLDIRAAGARAETLTASTVTAIERSNAALQTISGVVTEQGRLNEKVSENILRELQSIREQQLRTQPTAKNP